jgi:hypothetical protein
VAASPAAHGASDDPVQLAARLAQAAPAPETRTLDLTLPDGARTAVAAPEFGSAPTPGAPPTWRDEGARLYGIHRLELDLYGDDMRPQAGTPPR